MELVAVGERDGGAVDAFDAGVEEDADVVLLQVALAVESERLRGLAHETTGRLDENEVDAGGASMEGREAALDVLGDGGEGLNTGVAAAGEDDGERLGMLLAVSGRRGSPSEIVDAGKDAGGVGERFEGKAVFLGSVDAVVGRRGSECDDELCGLDDVAVDEGDGFSGGIDALDLRADDIDAAWKALHGDGDAVRLEVAACYLGEHRRVEHVIGAIDEGDAIARAEPGGEGASGVPAGKSASENDDVFAHGAPGCFLKLFGWMSMEWDAVMPLFCRPCECAPYLLGRWKLEVVGGLLDAS